MARRVPLFRLIFTSFLLFQSVTPPVFAQSNPIITNISPTLVSKGDRVTITGSNFILPNTSVSSYAVYLSEKTTLIKLAAFSPNINSTTWEQGTISFTIADSTPRVGTIYLTLGGPATTWNGSFVMNGGYSPTPIPSPVPTVPVTHEPTKPLQEIITPTSSPTTSTPTIKPTSIKPTPTSKTNIRSKIGASPTLIPVFSPTPTATETLEPSPATTIKPSGLSMLSGVWQRIINLLWKILGRKQ